MHYTLTVCPCCQEVDIKPYHERELDEPKYEEAECYQCEYVDQLQYNRTDHQSHVDLFHETLLSFLIKPRGSR